MIDTKKIKRFVLPNIPYLFLWWFFAKVGEAYRLSPGRDTLLKLIGTVSALDKAFAHPFPAPVLFDITIGLIGAAAIFFAVLYRKHNRKKWRKDIEYGSARWGNRKDIEPFVDRDPKKNVILTATESLMLNGRPANPKHARNKNILIIGGSGSGKTRFWLKPNLMQMHSSYVVTDPKGTVLVETGKMLQRGGYEIKVLNTIDFKKSMHYNPFPLLYKGGKRNNPKIQGSLYVCGTQTDGHGIGFTAGKGKAMNELIYEQAGDYLLPCIRLSDPPDAPPLGRYGAMHKEYLRRERPALYAELLLTERLYPLCREVDEAAAHRLAVIGKRETAHEVILSELVYI